MDTIEAKKVKMAKINVQLKPVKGKDKGKTAQENDLPEKEVDHD